MRAPLVGGGGAPGAMSSSTVSSEMSRAPANLAREKCLDKSGILTDRSLVRIGVKSPPVNLERGKCVVHVSKPKWPP